MSTSIKTKEKKDKMKRRKKSRRVNAIIYPIYKVFAWDLLFHFYLRFCLHYTPNYFLKTILILLV